MLFFDTLDWCQLMLVWWLLIKHKLIFQKFKICLRNYCIFSLRHMLNILWKKDLKKSSKKLQTLAFDTLSEKFPIKKQWEWSNIFLSLSLIF